MGTEEAEPIGSAKEWLRQAEAGMKIQSFAPALYSMEMAVEIALKAVLISFRVEVPKVHDIRKIVKMFLAGNSAIPKTFLRESDDFLQTFEILLAMRPAVGYGFETKINMVETRKRAEELLPKCAKIVSECEKVVNLNKKK